MKLLCLSDYLPDRALPLQLYLTLAATPSRGVIVASRLCIFNKTAKFFCNDFLPPSKLMAIQGSRVFNTTSKSKLEATVNPLVFNN